MTVTQIRIISIIIQLDLSTYFGIELPCLGLSRFHRKVKSACKLRYVRSSARHSIQIYQRDSQSSNLRKILYWRLFF